MVHESKNIKGKTKFAVVGLFYKIGRPDPVLKKVTSFNLFNDPKRRNENLHTCMIDEELNQYNCFLNNKYMLEMVSVVKIHKNHGVWRRKEHWGV